MKTTEIPEDLRTLDRDAIRKTAALNAAGRLKHFDPFSHKGNRGHLGLIAGSKGMGGAAVLAAMAANKSGVGKMTVMLPQSMHLLIHQSIPEALVADNKDLSEVTRFDALAIGPGIGTSPLANQMLIKSISSSKPLIVDADALNLLAKDPALLNDLPKDTLLTPHIGEWERLFGKSRNDKERIITSIKNCKKFNINVLIKGHISVLVTSEGNFYLNGTGNVGMAKAGSGDVLTGFLGGLIAQGYSSIDAGILGMFLHGLAGDFAMEVIGTDFMTATDQIHYLSKAFLSLRNSPTNP